MIPKLIPFLVVVPGMVLGAKLLWRYPVQVSVTALGVSAVLDCFAFQGGSINLGLTVYADDIACLLLFWGGAYVSVQKRQFPDLSCWPLAALFALTALNLARGTADFGLKPAGNGARLLAYIIVPSLSFLLLRPALRLGPHRIAKWLLGFGCVLMLIAVGRWIGVLPTSQDLIDAGDFRDIVRVLPADQAMVIGQALLAILYIQLEGGVRWWGISLAGALALTAIALQHRSVWSSTLVGLMWLGARTFRVSQRVWFQLATLGLLAFTVGATAVMVAGQRDHLLALSEANIEETQHENSTWSWRVEGYTQAIDRLFSADIVEIFVGPPSGRALISEPDSDSDAGTGLDTESDEDYASVHIHSRYVSTLAYYGIIGFVVLIAWFSGTALRVGSWIGPIQNEEQTGRVFLQALLLCQLTYFVAYSGGLMIGGVMAVFWLATDSPKIQAFKKTLAVPSFSYQAD